jgi:hemolysin D
VTAEIKTGRRTVLDFVLSPVKETLHEAGSER